MKRNNMNSSIWFSLLAVVLMCIGAGIGEASEPPFGYLDFPLSTSTLNGAVAVTGWALDDGEVAHVKIYRNPLATEGSERIYIGDGTFLEGARMDVAQLYPDYYNNTRAGWGYMLLTNVLPNRGNGNFTIFAVATDREGQETVLGGSLMYLNNSMATLPVGTIDTPRQGGTVSGADYANMGWVIARWPATIPADGSTIRLWIDGQPAAGASARYGIYRPDVGALFGSSGAGVLFTLDTTKLEEGGHNIAWSVTDDLGRSEGIGSRYFTVNNTNPARQQRARGTGEKIIIETAPLRPVEGPDINAVPPASFPLTLRRGFSNAPGNGNDRLLYPDTEGAVTLEIPPLERVEIRFGREGAAPAPVEGLRLVDGEYLPLPIGSTLDRREGVFYWHPGPGFWGEYEFLFITGGEKIRVHIRITH